MDGTGAADHWREHFGAIAADRLAGDQAAARELEVAFEHRGAAEEAYAARRRWWQEKGNRYGGVDVDSVPPIPTRGEPGEVAARLAAGVEPPSPRSVLRREEVAPG